MKKGWQTKPLADLCEVFADGDWIENKDQSPEGIRLIQTGNVGEGVFKDRGEKARYISEATFKRLRCTEILEGDCLISRLPDPAGRSCLLPDTGERMITAVDCTIVRFNRKQAFPEFFNYYSQSRDYLSTVDGETTGTTRKRISRSKLAQTLIPVPPLPEQQRIVGILDEAFEGIATAKANAGKNLKNARTLFDSHLQSVFTRRSDEVPLLRLASEITDGDHSPPPKAPTGVPFITISDIVKRTREVDFSNTFTVPAEYFLKLKPNKKPRVGDILYTVTGATLGIPVLVKEHRDFCFQRPIGLIRPNPDTDSAWLTYGLLSPQVFRQATIGSTGAAQKTVSLSVLRGLKLPKLALPEQKRIAARLDSLAAETHRLESIYQQKLVALDELKKSLLHQAFSGQLTMDNGQRAMRKSVS